MKISVALATFNGQRYLSQQLESLISQTRLPDELVVSDDASTDRTLEIVRAFATTAPFPVKILENNVNLGFKDNFFQAANACSGDWIAFCDQDDVWLPGKLQVLSAAAGDSSEQVLMICHSAQVVDTELNPTGGFYPIYPRAKLLNYRSVSPWWIAYGFTIFFRRWLVTRIPQTNRGLDPHALGSPMSHDQWVTRLAGVLGEILVLPDVLAWYRRHPAATSGVMPSERKHDVLLLGQFRRLMHAMSKSRQFAESASVAAKAQSEALSSIASEMSTSELKEKLQRAAIWLDEVGSWNAKRLELYEAKSIGRRFVILRELLPLSRYPAYAGGARQGLRSFIKDLFVAAGLGSRYG